MNSQQTQKMNLEQSPSFENKKICLDNGLERWPHRKYLAGKSIEEIKKEAARERNKSLSSSTVDGHRNNITTSGSQVKERLFYSPLEISKLNVQQQPGSRSMFMLRPHQESLTANFVIESSSGLDDFKYGFPSDGLSAFSNKWWGKSGNLDYDRARFEGCDELKVESKSSVNDDCNKTECQTDKPE